MRDRERSHRWRRKGGKTEPDRIKKKREAEGNRDEMTIAAEKERSKEMSEVRRLRKR